MFIQTVFSDNRVSHSTQLNLPGGDRSIELSSEAWSVSYTSTGPETAQKASREGGWSVQRWTGVLDSH